MLTIYVLFRMDIADNMATLLEAYIDKEDAMAELKALEERAKGRRKVWNYFIEECPLIEKEICEWQYAAAGNVWLTGCEKRCNGYTTKIGKTECQFCGGTIKFTEDKE